ncbi:hypothetical protein AYO22_06606 [Fonsecaea multimorphosa]|nr:hypothetical protein AYO22_06606 [Fonsecaea multimorphosa]
MDATSRNRASGAASSADPPESSGSVRQRILRESANSARERKRAGKPWSLKPPPPGTSVWDIRRNLEEVPIVLAKRKYPPAWDSLSESECRTYPRQDRHSCPSTSENDPIVENLQRLERYQMDPDDPVWKGLERMWIDAKQKKASESQNYEPPACSGIDGMDLPPLLQPDTCVISQEQLVKEVKGIYAGLVMVEKRCVEICAQQAQVSNRLTDEQWQALIALHRTLLHEHREFFLASQHPSASPALRNLALQHDLPGRLWRNGNKALLEILRHRIPDHLENMIAYIDLSFDMLTDLDAEFPELGESWADCMHDLETYRDFLKGIRVSGSNDDKGLRPSTVAQQRLEGYWENGNSLGSNDRSSYAASRAARQDGQHYFPFLGKRQSVNWLFGACDSDLSNALSQHLLPSDNFGESIGDEINIQEEFDCWFGDLNPNLFDKKGKNKWVLLGWLHFGKRIARSFWSYRRVFKVLLLNVLL